MDGHIFISYARQDGREYAERLDNDLASAGFATWRDTRSINEYQDFSAEIENAIRDASYVAVCVTPSIDANLHSFVRREIIYADSKAKPIIPLVFPNADVPTLVNHLTWIAFGDGKKPGQTLDYERGFDQLLGRLKETPKPSAPRDTGDPYREYLKTLYDRIIYYLNQTVFSLITLRSEATPGAVEEVAAQALPMAFFDMAGIGGKEDERIRFQNFYEAFDKYDGRALLLGEPGAGKTTTLMAFARDAVWRRLENPSLPLPLLAPIATWDAQKQTPLAEWLAETIPVLKREDVARLIAAGNALLMLDGLDELGSEREESDSINPLPASPASGGGVRYDPRQRFMEIMPKNNQVVVTCRVKDYEEIGEKIGLKGAVTLQALNDEQMREYLREMPDLWAALEADDELREVARTPLLLSLFTYAFAGLDEEAKKLRDLSRGDLRDKIFETYVGRRYEHEARKLKVRGEEMPFTLEQIYEVLGRVAMENVIDYWRQREKVLERDDLLMAVGSKELGDFTELTTRLHLLVKGEDQGLRFIHLLLRDYFAFGYALVHLRDTIADVRRSSVKALRQMGDIRDIEPLISALRDPDMFICNIAADALVSFGAVAIKPLISALDDPDVRHSAADSLVQIGAPAIQPLVTALTDPHRSVRRTVAHILGKIGDLRAVEPLIGALEDQESLVRNSVAEALGRIGIIDPLVLVLNDSDFSVRMSALRALLRIGTPEALEAVARWRREQGQSNNDDLIQ